MTITKSKEPNNLKLVAIWAFAESGLGGFMHALKIPFTGIVLGGFSVLILILLSQNAAIRKKPFLLFQYTLMVILVKLIASPHAPIMAYLAVAFQGLSAWLILGLLGSNKPTHFLFSVLALMESATQKLLVTTFLYGKAFWEALDQFGNQVNKDFGLQSNHSFSFYLISVYLGIYLLWAILIPFWVIRIQRKLNNSPSFVDTNSQDLIDPIFPKKGTKSRFKHLLPFAITLLTLSILYLASWDKKELLYIACRNLFALFVFVYLLGPFLSRVIQNWASKTSLKNDSSFLQIQLLLPVMKTNWELSLRMNQDRNKNLRYLFHVIETFLLISLVDDEG